jgi:cell division inhibitor SepF
VEEGLPMSALHKLKAYFGMVPADEVDDYEDEDVDYPEPAAGDEVYGAPADRDGPRRRLGKVRGSYQDDTDAGYQDARPRRQWSTDAPVRSALGPDVHREAPSRLRSVSDMPYNLSKITTLQPRSYSEARTIGEHYRDGIPVIINLTEMDEADAKRLVDFAAGLAFGLRGSIDKVTSRVFLLSPPEVDVASDDRPRLVDGGFYNHG